CMKTIIAGFGILIASLLILFQLAKFSYFNPRTGPEIWIAIISLACFGIGIFISRKYLPGKTQQAHPVTIDQKQVNKLGISKREYEILGLINEGLSNQQIADKLFLSENTVKKHVSNLFLKLDVQRRTEAIKKAKDLHIIA
ncbi:MAG TPA: response regulator transcription factor, partial [Chitinophagaceae bacterium]|nr:response regulator transcription factor [Chitinophagaceae bacterium]